MRRALFAAFFILLSLSVGADAAGRWCGNYARTHLVNRDPGTAYNLACNWQNWGSPSYAHEGAMVVWCSKHHHHVGKITGPCSGNVCVVTSGNDGHAVRTRARSVAGAIFREG
jgi:hypothetical protein